MKNSNLAVFDLDGVILESIDCKTRAFKDLYKNYGKEIQEKVERHHLQNGGISRFEKIKFYHKKYLNIELTDSEFRKLLDEFSRLSFNQILKSKYVKNVTSFIKQLKKKYSLYISTGTPTDEANLILKHKKIDLYFESIFGSPSTKKEHIEKILSKNNYENKFFFGDALSDYEAAMHYNMKFILRLHEKNLFMSRKKNIFKIINNFSEITINDL